MSMIYSALDVARYVIKYSNEQGYLVSNLKVQKLLYFIQALFLIRGGQCFTESIEAWDFGPVVPVVYRAYKQFGSNSIPTMDYEIVDYDYVDRDAYACIEDQDKLVINKVIDKFSNYTATDLVALTHQQTPWIEAYSNGYSSKIGIEAIRSYFSE